MSECVRVDKDKIIASSVLRFLCPPDFFQANLQTYLNDMEVYLNDLNWCKLRRSNVVLGPLTPFSCILWLLISVVLFEIEYICH